MVATNSGLDPKHVSLPVRALHTSATAVEVKRRYEEAFGEPPEKPGGWYRDDDWRRTSFVLDLVQPGKSVLDVGAGAGQFANMLAASGKFQSVTALDHIRFEKYSEFFPGLTRRDASLVALPFDDDEFDVVTCMEVLEHVPDDVLELGIPELRRVCRGQLVMSVPFEEAEPLSKGHLRRFTTDDVVARFPDAGYTLLDRPRMPWLIIEERLDGSTPDTPTAFVDLPAFTDGSADRRRIASLEAELARLRSRPTLRVEDRARALVGRARRRLASWRSSR